MAEVTATEAARTFADLLDAVEHRGERFTIVRRAKAIARLQPGERGPWGGSEGATAPPCARPGVDAGCGGRALTCRARGASLSRLLFDTTFLIDADRSGERLNDVISDEDEVAIGAITVAELRVGALLTTGRTEPPASPFSRMS